ncbi:AAA family ATPase [bacterium]|nr:AAA family ATPase [bacterium]
MKSYFEEINKYYKGIVNPNNHNINDQLEFDDLINDKLFERISEIKKYFDLNKYELEILKIAFCWTYFRNSNHISDIIKILKHIFNKEDAFFLKFFADDSALVQNGILVKEKGFAFSFRLSEKVIEWVLFENRGIFKEKLNHNKAKTEMGKTETISVNRIYNYLKKNVIGQDSVLKMVSVEFANHYLRSNTRDEISPQKSNLFFVGPTGCGKTYILKLLEGYLGIPVLILDANEFSETGYVGRDVHEIIPELYKLTKGNIDLAEKAVIYIDEIDKIGCKSSHFGHFSNRDVSGRSVQEELLTIIDGTKQRSDYSQWSNSRYPGKVVDTSRILFIAGGAFSDMSLIGDNKQKSRIGYECHDDTSHSGVRFTTADLVNYGIIPEFLGRFGMILQFNRLSTDNLKAILTNPHCPVISEYQKLAESYNLQLEFTEEALEYIAIQASLYNTGARALRRVINDIIYPEFFKGAYRIKPKRLVIDLEYLSENNDGKRTKNNGLKYCSNNISSKAKGGY